MFSNISSFSDVDVKNNTLIICDIDDTLIKFPKKFIEIYEMLKNSEIKAFGKYDEQLLYEDALYAYALHTNIEKPVLTDKNGFYLMLDKIKKQNSSLVFLTARDIKHEHFCKKHFTDSGLNYNDFYVYYTNNTISKGEYINKYIVLNNYDNIIFIDDRKENIESVNQYFPQIKCHLFLSS